MHKKILLIIAVLAITLGIYFFINFKKPMIVGRDRDKQGCLIGAGYTFDDKVGACTRAFELTPDIANAVRLSVEKVGRGYALTVVSFNSYEDGTYEITLESGLERTKRIFDVVKGIATEKY